jgi:hypothetical protein
MPGIEIIKAFISKAAAKGVRSTVVNPIGWLNVILVTGLATFLHLNSPSWLLVLMAVFYLCR